MSKKISQTIPPTLEPKAERKQKRGMSIPALIIAMVLLFVAGGLVLYQFLSIQKAEEVETIVALESEEADTIEEDDNSEELESEEDRNGENEDSGGEVTEDPEEDNQEIGNSGEETSEAYPWPDEPTQNVYYQLADEDENYVYFIYQDNVDWNYYGGIPSGRIVRFAKDGTGSPEVLLEYVDGIYSLAVAGGYIYYSVPGSNGYDYMRIKSDGSESEEYLFSESYSLLYAYEENIYLLLTEEDVLSYGIYHPLERTYEAAEMDNFYVSYSMMGAHSNLMELVPFSVYEDALYYGCFVDGCYYYGKYIFDQATTTHIMTLEAYDLEPSGIDMSEEGYMCTYGPPIIYDVNENNSTTIWDGGFRVKTADDLVVEFYEYDTMFFYDNGSGSLEECYDFEFRERADGQPGLAISENWIIMSDQAIWLDKDQGVTISVSFDGLENQTALFN